VLTSAPVNTCICILLQHMAWRQLLAGVDRQTSSKISSSAGVTLIRHDHYKKLTRRWDSERELSLRQHIVHVQQNTIDSCINSATDRRGGYVLEGMFTKFCEITQSNGHYAVQGHSRSPILVPIESSYTTFY